MGVLNNFRSGESNHVKFIICPHHPFCRIVDGQDISFRVLGEKMQVLQIRAWKMIERDILRGLEIPDDLWQACGRMQDALGDRTPGYWFGMHSSNHSVLKFWRANLLKKLRSGLFTNDYIVKRPEASQLLDHCNHLQKCATPCYKSVPEFLLEPQKSESFRPATLPLQPDISSWRTGKCSLQYRTTSQGLCRKGENDRKVPIFRHGRASLELFARHSATRNCSRPLSIHGPHFRRRRPDYTR